MSYYKISVHYLIIYYHCYKLMQELYRMLLDINYRTGIKPMKFKGLTGSTTRRLSSNHKK